MKEMKRALRRHHQARLKALRCRWLSADERLSGRIVGKKLATPKACSCWICGNRRRHLGLTRQELRGLERLGDD